MKRPQQVDSDNVTKRTTGIMDTARRTILAMMLLAIPLRYAFIIAEVQPAVGDPYGRLALLLIPLDELWIMFTLLAVPVVWRAWKRRPLSWGLVATTAIFVAMVVAYGANPDPLGLTLVARAGGSIAVIAVITTFSRRTFRLFVAAPLLTTATVQSIYALWQVAVEPAGYVQRGPWVASQGTLYHPYVLAGLLLLAVAVSIAVFERGRWRYVWMFGIAMSSAAIMTTFSRAGGIAIAIMLGAYVWGFVRSRDRYFGPLLNTSIPIATTGALLWEGWLSAFQKGVQAGDLDSVSSGRLTMMLDSLRIAGSAPITGVGPGRYIQVLAQNRPELVGSNALSIVHSVPFALGSEAGILIGVAYLFYMIGLGVRALRTSSAALAVFGSLITFIVFDKFTYSNGNAILLAAVWLATLDQLTVPSFGDGPRSPTDLAEDRSEVDASLG